MTKAINIFVTTIIADLFGLLITVLAWAIMGDSNAGLLVIFVFGNIFIPTLIGVILFRFVKSITYQTDSIISLLRQSVILTIIFLFGLVIWSIADGLFTDGLTGSIFYQIKQDFISEFLGYVPATIAIALIIPFIDNWLRKSLKQSAK